MPSLIILFLTIIIFVEHQFTLERLVVIFIFTVAPKDSSYLIASTILRNFLIPKIKCPFVEFPISTMEIAIPSSEQVPMRK